MSEPKSASSTSKTGPSAVATTHQVAEAASCTSPPSSSLPTAAERSRAIDALLAGRSQEAAKTFERVGRANPRDLAAQALHVASAGLSSQATRKVVEGIGGAKPLPSVPAAYTFRKPVPVGGQSAPLKLERVSQGKNLITDTGDWFGKNGLKMPALRPSAADIPEYVASTLSGRPAQNLFVHADHTIAIYGTTLAAFAPNKAPLAFDTGSMVVSQGGRPEVVFAQIVGRTLLVSLARNGYAKDVAGKTAYVAAIGIDDGELKWSSEPLVANAQNFLVVGDYIVTGYGFTAEPDFLFVLELASGKVVQRLPTTSGPDYIVPKGDQIYVRTYDTDYVFKPSTGVRAAAPAALGADRVADQSARGRDIRCWVDTAVASLDARKASALRPAVQALWKTGADEVLVGALEGALQRLERQEHGPAAVDLTTVGIVVAESPPWDYSLRTAKAAPLGKPPRLVKRKGGSADPARGIRLPTLSPATPPASPSGAFFIAPVGRGTPPAGARQDLPSSYGFEDLRVIAPDGERLILVYGGRYVVVLRGDTTEHVLDLEAYRHPPKANPQWKEFAVEDVTFAKVRGDILYVANGGGSYAREVFGKKGFMSAIELRTGKLLWRSQPLVTGGTFAISGDFIVSGYGFTDEADYLYALRLATGEVVARTPLDSAPGDIGVVGGRILVEAYGHAYEFDLVSSD